MPSRRLLSAVLVAVAVLLHLGAHIGFGAGVGRTALPEDAPALLANAALDNRAQGGLGATLSAALSDPAVGWDPGGEVVGATRFRPVTTALFALERAVGRGGTVALAGWVGLLLHVLVVLGSAALVRDLGGRSAAIWVTGLLVAAAPSALAAAAWPARQGLVLAAALGVAGLRLCLRRGALSVIAGGLLLGAATLSHEMGVGLALGAVALLFADARPDGEGSGGEGSGGEGAPATTTSARVGLAALALAPSLVAVVWRGARLTGAAPASAGPDVFDGLVGALATLVAPLVPGTWHLAPGPWTASALARAGAGVVLAAALAALWRRRARPWAAAGLAVTVAALPVALIARSGAAPFHTGMSYVLLPLLAATLALGAERAGRAGTLPRVGAALALALLVASSVAATLDASASFRSGPALIARAREGAPDALVPRAWEIGERVRSADDDVAQLLAILPDSLALAESLATPRGDATETARALARDGASAMSVATVLAVHARRVAATSDEDLGPYGLAQIVDVEQVAAAAAAVAPRWSGGWLVLAQTRTRLGAVSGALDAALVAAELAPDDVTVAELAARLALDAGRTGLAVEQISRAAELERATAAREDRPVRREHLLLGARVLAGDAAARGILVSFDRAARLVQPLFDAGDRGRDIAQVLYDIYLQWGDFLVSADKTAMARLSYVRAEALGGSQSEAAEHLGWLDERLRTDLARAERDLARAAQGEGNVANALLQVAIVLCRSARWDEADEIFARIEAAQGGMNAPLRHQRAIHRYASRDDSYEKAISELRIVLEEAPELVDARYHMANLLAEMGRFRDAAEAYRRAAHDGPEYEWSADALQAAAVLEDVVSGQRGTQ